jgi:hypothetical protein
MMTDDQERAQYLREHIPDFIELDGGVIDMARVPEIVASIAEQFGEENPGLVLRPGLDLERMGTVIGVRGMLADGSPVTLGDFDSSVLLADVEFPPPGSLRIYRHDS